MPDWLPPTLAFAAICLAALAELRGMRRAAEAQRDMERQTLAQLAVVRERLRRAQQIIAAAQAWRDAGPGPFAVHYAQRRSRPAIVAVDADGAIRRYVAERVVSHEAAELIVAALNALEAALAQGEGGVGRDAETPRPPAARPDR